MVASSTTAAQMFAHTNAAPESCRSQFGGAVAGVRGYQRSHSVLRRAAGKALRAAARRRSSQPQPCMQQRRDIFAFYELKD
jgi:hypothetical protein